MMQFILTQTVDRWGDPIGFVGYGYDRHYYAVVGPVTKYQSVILVQEEESWVVPEDERDVPPKHPPFLSKNDRKEAQDMWAHKAPHTFKGMFFKEGIDQLIKDVKRFEDWRSAQGRADPPLLEVIHRLIVDLDDVKDRLREVEFGVSKLEDRDP